MCRSTARRSRYRGRGIRHDNFFREPLAGTLARALAAVLASLLLAACAAAPRHRADAPVQTPSPERAPKHSFAQAQAQAQAQLMIDAAAAMIGQPYRFGGAAPGGFDCSGLVEYAAQNAGIPMPRTAAEQLRIGSPVSRTELQPGDLVFMHLSGKELHVAIALDRQLFVHAPSSGGYVRVDSLIAPPYSKGFIGARRVVSSPDEP
jgi:cell wall-associated NlpC family hydrolase